MKHPWNFALVVLAGILALAAPAHADNENLDFTFANRTGYGIRAIYITPSTSTDWGGNLLAKPVDDGGQLAITFDAKAKADQWDIRIVWAGTCSDYSDVVWKKCRLGEITKFTLRYNRETDETSAQTE